MATEAPAIVLSEDLFVWNMRLLWRFDPDMAFRVDAIGDEERLAVERTRSGAVTAKATAPGGTPLFLHSRHDPVAEAETWARSLSLADTSCFVICGMGLGYHLKALFAEIKGEALIVCVEPSVATIATALASVDLTELLGSPRFVLLTDADKSRLHARLQPFGTLMMLGTQVLRHAPSARLAEEAQASIVNAVTEFITYTRMGLLTLVSNSKITCRNIAMNLAAYITTPPIDRLKDRFSKCPAVVISAGPSLSRNIDQLAALKGKAVLCAVQTTLRPLMDRGIVPDFVTSLDFHEMSRKFFEGVGDLSNTHLIAEPKATWHVVDAYPGPVSLLDNSWARLVLGDELGARAGLPAGATVAHLAFYLAVYLGCDPILFVGQDLAFTGHVFYVPGVEIHRAWRGELNRFHSIEQKEWDRIARNRPILRRVPSVDGGELYTDELLFTYLEQFEKDIAAVPCRVINATEGGARIRGTQTLSLSDAVREFCREPIDAQRWAYRAATPWRDPSRLPAGRAALERRIEELDEALGVCDELLDLLRELEGLTHDADRFNRRLNRVDELRTKVARESRAYQIINAAAQLTEFRRFSADRRIDASELSDVDRAKRQIARDIDFISGVKEGALEVRPMLTEALNRMDERGPQSCG